jgi:hypothetical protein
VQTDVKAVYLSFLGGPHSDNKIHKSQNDPGANESQTPTDGDANTLIENLARVPVDPTEREQLAPGILQAIVDGIGCEYSREQRAQSSARAVNAESIESVIVDEPALHRGDHEEAEHTGEETDQQSGEGLYEPRGRRDGDKSGHCA